MMMMMMMMMMGSTVAQLHDIYDDDGDDDGFNCGPTPWQIYDDDDKTNLSYLSNV